MKTDLPVESSVVPIKSSPGQWSTSRQVPVESLPTRKGCLGLRASIVRVGSRMC